MLTHIKFHDKLLALLSETEETDLRETGAVILSRAFIDYVPTMQYLAQG